MFRLKKLAYAQLLVMGAVAPAAAVAEEEVREEVVVVGSQIQGADVEGLAPVSLVSADDIEATAATSGDELLASIPQAGEVGFSPTNTVGVNSARGDVSSVNLRGLGTGNTLVLINGRRMVLHPGTQTESRIPVTTVNSNTLPVTGIQNVEVLRDGAGALYGSDAVAGVINYVLKKDYEGGEISVQYGNSEGTSLEELTLNVAKGFQFNDGATNLTVVGSYFNRSGFPATDLDFAGNQDLRDLAGSTSTSFDNRSSTHGWGVFDFDDAALGRLHVQPADLAGCGTSSLVTGFNDGDICLGSGEGPRDLRFNANAVRTLSNDTERYNLFSFLNHEFESGLEFFAEAGWYSASVDRINEGNRVLGSGRFDVPADYYYNPFGPVTFADGRVNPNRIVGPEASSGISDDGVGFTLRRWAILDGGLRETTVDDTSYRLVAGFEGTTGDWDWELGGLYSEAKTTDSTANRYSATGFQQAVSLDTPDAYNLFTGLDIVNPDNPIDTTPNPQSVLDRFRIDVDRISKTTLAMADLKFSNASLFSLPHGDVAMGAGLEIRDEDFVENRDDRSDGTIQFVDVNTGVLVNGSDIVGSSASGDADGRRRVSSAYLEFLVPLIRDLPGIQTLDLQLAGRYESFSDVGDVSRDKIAISWYPIEWLQFRAAKSGGFRAPNLIQLNQEQVTVSNTVDDSLVTGDSSLSVQEFRGGNPNLQPEDSDSFSWGVVVTPLEGLTVTADVWRVQQFGIVGLFGGDNHVTLDGLLRDAGTGFNPAVIRDEDLEVLRVNDTFQNLAPREVKGVDVSILYDFMTDIGEFDVKLNGAYLTKFQQGQSAGDAAIEAAGGDAEGAGSLIGDRGRPRWRGSFSARWENGPWSASLFAKYVHDVFDPSVTVGGDPLEVDSVVTVNVSGDYTFEGGALDQTRIRLGVRNLFDEEPPFADETFGYIGSVHSNRDRYFYVSVRKRFE